MNGSLHLNARPSPWRWVGLAATAGVVLAVGVWSLPDDPAERPAPPPSVTANRLAQAQAEVRGDAPFPDIDLALLDITPRGALIAVASRPATYTVGQEVFPGIRLEHVDPQAVTLRFGAQSRELALRPATPIASAAPADEKPDAPAVDARQLTTARPQLAAAFLNEVQVHPDPRGGFVVDHVLPESRYDRLGLKAGDVVYSIDTPAMSAVDESSMVALMQQTQLELDVVRKGTQMRLAGALNVDPDPPQAPPEAR